MRCVWREQRRRAHDIATHVTYLSDYEKEKTRDVERIEEARSIWLHQRLQREREDEDQQRGHDLQVRIAQQRAGERDEEFAKHHDERLPCHNESTASGVISRHEKTELVALESDGW